MDTSGFALVTAVDAANVIGIGANGEYSIPWHDVIDMKFFRELTTCHYSTHTHNNIIVGFNTWSTLPVVYKNNPARRNYVVGTGHYPTVADALAGRNGGSHTYVIGGAKIYREALMHPDLTAIYLTDIVDTQPYALASAIKFPVDKAYLSSLKTNPLYVKHYLHFDRLNIYVLNQPHFAQHMQRHLAQQV